MAGVDSLKPFESLEDFPGHSGGWVSCPIALELSGLRRQSDMHRRGLTDQSKAGTQAEETHDVDSRHDATRFGQSFKLPAGRVIGP